MASKALNPWNWQAGFGFSHGVEIYHPTRIVEVSGQCATGADGAPQVAGDMAGQIRQALDNVEAVLKEAGMDLSHVVRIRVFATDVGAALENWGEISSRIKDLACRPASTLVGTTALFSPDMLVEIEATAAE